MICKFCGNVIEDSSDFCFICGQKTVQEPATYTAEADIFNQPDAIETPAEETVPAAANEAYVAAPFEQNIPQGTPIYAQTAPVYAQQVFIQQIPVANPQAQQAPFVQVNGQTVNAGDPSVCSKAKKFFAALFSATFILQFISWIWYGNAKKAGFMKKAEDILNSSMVGLCIFMVVLCVVLALKFMV